MRADPNQLEFPFASLDFPDRAVVLVCEIAKKLGGTVRHYLNLIDSGDLVALNTARKTGVRTERRMIRVPIESYRNFIVESLTGEARFKFLEQLPTSTLQDLLNELTQILKSR